VLDEVGEEDTSVAITVETDGEPES
jgi:hypothetical protein